MITSNPISSTFVAKVTNPQKRQHTTAQILRRKTMKGIAGIPRNMKLDPKKGGAMTQGIRKAYGLESIDIQRILEIAVTLTAKQRADSKSNTISGKETKSPESLKNKIHYPPKKEIPIQPTSWGNKRA